MKKLTKNKKILIIVIGIIAISLWCVSCMRSAYYAPKWEKRDISSVIKKEEKTKEDYEFLFSQTGLGKSAIDELLEKGKEEEIYKFYEQYFKECDYEREFLFFPIVAIEAKTGAPLKIAPLKRGDVLVSLTTHSLGFRHGHAALVSNGETGKIIEHLVLGEVSSYSSIYGWNQYPTFALLRYKNAEIAEKAVDFAEEKLLGIPYNPLAGLIKKDKSGENPISSSHCSHLVWQSFYAAGADIDGNGGKLVMPGDFLKCKDFEIVQIYGIKP